MRPVLLAALAFVLAGCAVDPAEREYTTALRGEETGMTRVEQIAHLDRAIELAPRRAYYYETRAIYEIDLKQFGRARADLNRDVALLPRPYAYFLRGLVACQAGDAAASLADFDRAIRGQPSNTQFYRGRSLARSATGDVTGALQDAEHLVKAAPQQAESFYARGVANALQGRDSEAVTDFDRAARMRPELVYVVEARAQSLERLGDAARAQADRAALEHLRSERSGCAACLDPFRY
jgi:tetratricopeptide (TPR) repeat protein